MRSWILSLSSRYQVILFILCTMAAAFCSAIAIHFIFAPFDLSAKYTLITTIHMILGTVYAVLIAFCISGVWQNFTAGELAATNEAAALNDLVHILAASSVMKVEQIKQLAIHYLKQVIAFEWENIAKGQVQSLFVPEEKTFKISQEIIREVQSIQPENARDNTIFSHTLNLLTKWLDARRIRIMLLKGNTAKSLWPLLITGAIILFGFHGLYIFDNHRLWMTLLLFSSGIIGVSFYLIFTLDSPATGSPSVSSASFEYAVQIMEKVK